MMAAERMCSVCRLCRLCRLSIAYPVFYPVFIGAALSPIKYTRLYAHLGCISGGFIARILLAIIAEKSDIYTTERENP